MDDIYAIIPVSKFKNAKTRLSPFLSEDEREQLLKAILRDVNDALKKYVDKIFIISADRDVLDYAESLNLNTIIENDNSNLNRALKQAMKYCIKKTRKIGDETVIGPFAYLRPGSTIGKNVKIGDFVLRSEERRVGKECRSRWSPYH